MDEKQREQIEQQQVFVAKKKVKKIRSLYLNIFAFVALNLILFIDKYLPNDTGNNYYVLILMVWGGWLGYSFLKVYGNFWIFSEKWERKTLKKVLSKEKKALKDKLES